MDGGLPAQTRWTAVDSRPIGVFDSGIGGLSILAQVRRLLPNEGCLYLADQAHVPYGPRPLAEVSAFSHAITQFLLSQDAKLIVVACNTASAAALKPLRLAFPQVPFVGMEPAVKPAAERSASRRIGVLATPATFEGELFASLVERYGEGLEIYQETVPGLVERIEQGDLAGPRTRAILESAVRPLKKQGIDTLVLGCTHYPFVIPLIQELLGDSVEVIDPAPAVARQTQRLLAAHKLAAPEQAGKTTYFSTLPTSRLRELAQKLVEPDGRFRLAHWQDDHLVIQSD